MARMNTRRSTFRAMPSSPTRPVPGPTAGRKGPMTSRRSPPAFGLLLEPSAGRMAPIRPPGWERLPAAESARQTGDERVGTQKRAAAGEG